MTSKIKLELQSNGNLINQTTDTDKIIQGSVAVTEYHLTVKGGAQGDYAWRQTDVIYMSMTRPGGQTGQVKMTPTGTGWVYTSNGWETDTDIVTSDLLEISFICRRFSTLSIGRTAMEKTTQKIELPIIPSTAFTPRNINITVAEELEEAVTLLQLNKVDRVNVENLIDYPEIQYAGADGIKTPNAMYYNFEHNVYDVYGVEVPNAKGAILVTTYEKDTGFVQYELFMSEDTLYSREIKFHYEDDLIVIDSVGNFNEITHEAIKEISIAINNIWDAISSFEQTVNDTYLKKDFNVLVARTYAQLTDLIAITSGSETFKMTLQTLRTYLLAGITGLSFQIFEVLPPTGVSNIIYLTPIVDSIEHVDTFTDLPTTGVEKVLYVVDDEHTAGITGWYNWNTTTEAYVNYNLGFYEDIWLEEIEDFELIGSTKVDLTGYATEVWVQDNFATKAELANYAKSVSINGETPVTPDSSGNIDLPMPKISFNGVDMLIDPAKTSVVIRIAADGFNFTLRTQTTGTNNFVIKWGDGVEETITTINPSHIYEKAGMYLIEIDGTFNGFRIAEHSSTRSLYIEAYLSNSTGTIWANAFEGCNRLQMVQCFNSGGLQVMASAFKGCFQLEEFKTVLSNNLINVGNDGFSGCGALKVFPFGALGTIGTNAFSGNRAFTSVMSADSTTLQGSAFSGSFAIQEVVLPRISNIGASAFNNCQGLVSVYMPAVTIINNEAFSGCTRLRNLTIGTVSTVGANAFLNVIIDNLTINGNPTDAQIADIKTLLSSAGATFTQDVRISHSLQVEKTPSMPNDVIRNQDLEDAISSVEAGSKILTIRPTAKMGFTKVESARINASSQPELAGYYIWTDGTNVYYSYLTTHKQFNKKTRTWTDKTWNGLTSFYGTQIWSDGINIYYSAGAEQYVLDIPTSTWLPKIWGTMTTFDAGPQLWTDGTNIYRSAGYTSSHFVLDKATSNWIPKVWNGPNEFFGGYVWTDGTTIYRTNGDTLQYTLDTSTSTWNLKTWTSPTFPGDGLNIWSDGYSIYFNNRLYSSAPSIKMVGEDWPDVIWSGIPAFDGTQVWTDGTDIYVSIGDINHIDTYVLGKTVRTR